METLDLTPFFTTKSQANDFATRLSAIAEEVYHTEFSLEKTSLEHLGIHKKEVFMKFLNDNQIPTDNAGAIKEFCEEVQKTITELPIINLTLAFEPKEKTLKALSDWFQLNIKKQFLLDITIDETIIAGAAIRYKGQYADFSSKPLFDKLLQDIMTNHFQPKTAAPPPTPSHQQTPAQQQAPQQSSVQVNVTSTN